MKVKICGMRDPENVAAIAATGVDLLGFIFYPRSPRYVYQYHQAALPREMSSLQRVGVFVNPAFDHVIKEVQKWQLDFVQLHGDEDPVFCRKLNESGEAKVIKAFRVGDHVDEALLQKYSGSVDQFLFDTLGESYGGTGKTFSWDLLKDLSSVAPYFISGGLGPENIEELLQFVSRNASVADQLVGVDLNSGVETAPAVKSVEKVQRVIEILNREVVGGRV